jgi:hypothetical protein
MTMPELETKPAPKSKRHAKHHKHEKSEAKEAKRRVHETQVRQLGMRARYKVTDVSTSHLNVKEVTLTPQHDSSIPEERRYGKTKPLGQIVLGDVDNPPAQAFFLLGKQFYVDFTEIL